ncbi:hypothetical protein KAR91_86970 [Candidatus Pacearchaeota archaeon]|nr:hypothetical protein [Candidatus Pacearchaeota archaeon]
MKNLDNSDIVKGCKVFVAYETLNQDNVVEAHTEDAIVLQVDVQHNKLVLDRPIFCRNMERVFDPEDFSSTVEGALRKLRQTSQLRMTNLSNMISSHEIVVGAVNESLKRLGSE